LYTPLLLVTSQERESFLIFGFQSAAWVLDLGVIFKGNLFGPVWRKSAIIAIVRCYRSTGFRRPYEIAVEQPRRIHSLTTNPG